MAKITSLHLGGYKGQNCVEKLTGLDIFVGPNGAGKSARPEGLALATLGYIPGQPKQAHEIMKKCPGDEMSVGATLDTGFSFMRTFTKNTSVDRKTGEEKVSIKETVNVTPAQKGETTETARKARIATEMGDMTIHLDFQEFESLSPARKREYLASFVSNADSGWNKDKVAVYLKEKILNIAMKENSPEAYEVTEQMITKALDVWTDGLTVDSGIYAMLEWSKAQQSAWNAKRKDAAGAVRQLADTKNQIDETDRGIATNKETLNRLRIELVEVEKEISRGQEVKKVFKDRKARIADLRKTIELLDKDIAPVYIADIEKQIVDLKTKIKMVDVDTTELEGRLTDLNHKKSEIENQLAQAKHKKALAIEEGANLRRAIEAVNKTGGLCVISSLIKCPKDFTPFIEHVQSELSKVKDLIAELDGNELAIAEALNDLETQIKELEESRKQVFATAQEATNKNERLKSAIADLERQKLEAENAAVRKQEQTDLYKAELKNIEVAPIEAVPELDVLELQSAGLRKSITELGAKVEKQEASRATLMNMQASMLDNKDAEHKYNASKCLAEELGPKGIQGELLKGGLEPLRTCIQENFTILGIPHEFAFRTESERGQEIFEFGWNKRGSFISFDALSTGERMMVLLAVLTSLLQRGDAKVRILAIDEFQSLDGDNYTATLCGLKALYDADKVDNILVAGILSMDEVEGWNVRVLEKEGEQAVTP